MTEIMPFPENNNETVLLDRPENRSFYFFKKRRKNKNVMINVIPACYSTNVNSETYYKK